MKPIEENSQRFDIGHLAEVDLCGQNRFAPDVGAYRMSGPSGDPFVRDTRPRSISLFFQLVFSAATLNGRRNEFIRFIFLGRWYKYAVSVESGAQQRLSESA